MRFMKPTAAVLALAVAALSFSSAAEARHRHRHHHHHGGGDALAAGIFGFAAGAIFSGALSQPRYYNYYEPAPVYVAPPPVAYRTAPVYYGDLEPWTPEWYASCEYRYRSFNAETGYFYGFDGQYHFCR